MKKPLLIVAAAFLMMASLPAKAQIFIADDEDFANGYRNARDESDLPFTPTLGVTNDQYAPLGEGIALLGLLGGAYLIGKKRREE